jgi:prepilin-type N-terminal cleavage/methylation domain-containing protein
VRRGFSLSEIVITAAIFSVVVALAAELLIHGLRATAAGERRQTALDECRNVLYRFSEEIRDADAILDPDRNTLERRGSTWIVFRTPKQTVGYRVVPNPRPQPGESPSGVVQRVLFYPGYTAAITGTQIVIPGTARNLTSAPSTISFLDYVSRDSNGVNFDTVELTLGITPYEGQTQTMRTKKTLWPGVFPAPLLQP